MLYKIEYAIYHDPNLCTRIGYGYNQHIKIQKVITKCKDFKEAYEYVLTVKRLHSIVNISLIDCEFIDLSQK